MRNVKRYSSALEALKLRCSTGRKTKLNVAVTNLQKQGVGGKQIMGYCHSAVAQMGLQVGDAPSTDRASQMIQDAKLRPHVLGLLGLRHNPRDPTRYQTSSTSWDY